MSNIDHCRRFYKFRIAVVKHDCEEMPQTDDYNECVVPMRCYLCYSGDQETNTIW